MAMKESEIQKQIIQYLQSMNYMYWRNYVGPILRGQNKVLSKNPMSGMPDILGIFNSHHRLFAIEVKSKKGKLHDKQHIWIDKLTAAGALCLVARHVDDVREVFEACDKEGLT